MKKTELGQALIEGAKEALEDIKRERILKMKMKKIIVPKYVFKDELGEFVFQDVTLLFPSDSVVTPDSFDQDSDDYSISSEEIDRMWKVLKDAKRERILDIVSEMYEAGIERSFCTSAGEMALKFEGVYDLMVLWSDEKDPAEREAIIQDLEDTLEDVMFYDITAWDEDE